MSFVHVWKPGTTGRTLLLLHGTGGDETQMLPIAEAIGTKDNILSVKGKVLEGPMPRWFRRLAEGVFDHEDLVFRTNELVDWLVAKAPVLGFDLEKTVAIGYSNGATTAASMMLLRPESLLGAALLRPSVPFRDGSPVDLAGKHVWLAPGVRDTIVDPQQGYELSGILTDMGAATTLAPANAGHELTQGDIDGIREWLTTTVGAGF